MRFAPVILLVFASCFRLDNSPLDSSQGSWLSAVFTYFLTLKTYVAVGAQGKAYTSNDGLSWTQRTITSDTTLNFNAVASSGSTLFAVGGNGSTQAVIYTSGDGVTWTQSLAVSGTQFNDVVVAGGKVVAVGASLVRTSANGGASWSSGSGTSGTLVRVVHDGTYFLTVADAITAFRSTDGFTFSATPSPPEAGGKNQAAGDLLAIGSRVIYAGTDGSFSPVSDSSFTVNGGGSWTSDSVPVFAANATNYPLALAFGGSRLAAVGQACRIDFTDNITSLTWSSSALTMSGCSGITWNGLTHDGSKFIAVGNSGRIAVSGSAASTDWSIQTIGSANILGVTLK